MIVGGEGGGRSLGGFDRQILRAPILSLLVRQRLRPLVSKERREDLAVLKGFIEAGKVTPLIDRACPLGEAPRGDPVPGGRSRPREDRDHGGRRSPARGCGWLGVFRPVAGVRDGSALGAVGADTEAGLAAGDCRGGGRGMDR